MQIAVAKMLLAGKSLSPRQVDVLRRLSFGGTYASIGAAAYLHPDTVRSVAYKAMKKLGANTRTEAVAIAIKEELI
jgi:DNA-binding CsgD family transcriptional regulator